MGTYPPQGLTPYDVALKEYLDGTVGSKQFDRNNAAVDLGPDTATITVDSSADPLFNRAYSRGSAVSPPVDWPVDNGRVQTFVASAAEQQSAPQPYGSRNASFWTDANEIVAYVFGTSGDEFEVYANGRPAAAVQTFNAGTKFYLVKLVFTGARPRLIKFRTAAAFHSVFVKKPYTCWKPPPPTDPLALVIGDSVVTPTVMPTSGTTPSPSKISGMYQLLAARMGLSEVLTDGVNGSGFLTTGGVGTYRQRLAAYDPAWFTPDLIIFHGGGANDRNTGQSNAAIIAEATLALAAARAKYPHAKLVFVEGIAIGAFASFVPDYPIIREGVRTAAAASKVYYLDTTTVRWYQGLGNVVTPNADAENANIYLGGDNAHFTVLGNLFGADRLSADLVRVMRDDGALVNTVI